MDCTTKTAAGRVIEAFLIYDTFEILSVFATTEASCPIAKALLNNGKHGLSSVVSAGSLPYHLINHAAQQRRFDSFFTAERIRSIDLQTGEPSEEFRHEVRQKARQKMDDFINSDEGIQHFRDQIIHDLDDRLALENVKAGASELLVQTLISTWSVFESSVRAFIIAWVNADPARAKPLLVSNDLKTYFGKQVVDLEVISDFGFNLAGSMGDVLFLNRRLDNLSVTRGIMKAFFNDDHIRNILGDDMWWLNQRRHLFVHRRGIVDTDYLARTSDNAPTGERLHLTSHDVMNYVVAVRDAILAIAMAADRVSNVNCAE